MKQWSECVPLHADPACCVGERRSRFKGLRYTRMREWPGTIRENGNQ